MEIYTFNRLVEKTDNSSLGQPNPVCVCVCGLVSVLSRCQVSLLADLRLVCVCVFSQNLSSHSPWNGYHNKPITNPAAQPLLIAFPSN